MRDAVEQYSRTEPNEQVLDALLANVRYCAGNFDDPQVYGGRDAMRGGVRRGRRRWPSTASSTSRRRPSSSR